MSVIKTCISAVNNSKFVYIYIFESQSGNIHDFNISTLLSVDNLLLVPGDIMGTRRTRDNRLQQADNFSKLNGLQLYKYSCFQKILNSCKAFKKKFGVKSDFITVSKKIFVRLTFILSTFGETSTTSALAPKEVPLQLSSLAPLFSSLQLSLALFSSLQLSLVLGGFLGTLRNSQEPSRRALEHNGDPQIDPPTERQHLHFLGSFRSQK